jgi:hypothetical protein
MDISAFSPPSHYSGNSEELLNKVWPYQCVGGEKIESRVFERKSCVVGGRRRTAARAELRV